MFKVKRVGTPKDTHPDYYNLNQEVKRDLDGSPVISSNINQLNSSKVGLKIEFGCTSIDILGCVRLDSNVECTAFWSLHQS